jgi:prepilin peptidase CpaA
MMHIVLVAILPALFAAAAVWDLTSYTIPNVLILAFLTLFVVFAGVAMVNGQGFSLHEAGMHAAAGAIGLVAGMALFAAGWIGGGDAKLFAVAALWLGWDMLFPYTLLASILGGGLTLGLLAFRTMPLPAFLARQEWIMRLADRQGGIPYGIALATAALIVLPETAMFKLAVG